MKILLAALMLFGLGCATKEASPVKQTQVARTEGSTPSVPTVQPESKRLENAQPVPFSFPHIEYCPLSEVDCFNMQERVAARAVIIQPILVTDGKNPEAMKKDWQDFVSSLPEEISSALQSPKVITTVAADIQEQEDWAPQLNRQRIANKIGALPEHTLAVVYWDLSLGGNQTYDWDHGIYYRSFYAELTSADRKEHLGRRFEEAFLAWLINIHV